MTVALIAVFFCLAVCALIGWGFTHLLGRATRRLRKHQHTASAGPTIVLRHATPDELLERQAIRNGTPSANGRPRTNGTPQDETVIETYFEKGKWKNKVRGNSRASNVHDTREAAVAAAEEMARKRNAKHVIVDSGDSAHA